MTVSTIQRSYPDSVNVGGNRGMRIPAGAETDRPNPIEDSTLRGNTTSGELDYFINGQWFSLQVAGVVSGTRSSDFTASAKTTYPVNTTDGSVTVLLPTNAPVGSSVTLMDINSTWSINPLILSGNGNNIESSSANKTLTTKGDVVSYTWTGSAVGWVQTQGFKDAPVSAPVTIASANATIQSGISYLLDMGAVSSMNLTFPQNPVIGSSVELTVLYPDAANADTVPLALLQAASNEYIETADADYLVEAPFYSMEFIYTGDVTVGWKIIDRSLISAQLNRKTFTTGDVSSYITDGRYEIVGATSNYTNVADTVANMVYGILDVTRRSQVCLQELTIAAATSNNVQPNKYWRIGRVLNDVVTFHMDWVRANIVEDQSGNLRQAPANLYESPEGLTYNINPSVGTPDHAINDQYIVNVMGRRIADANYSTASPDVFIEATNTRTKVRWHGFLRAGTFGGWRKEGTFIYHVAEGQTLEAFNHSSDVIIIVESEGDQSIHMNAGDTIDDPNHVRVGDRVSIRNLKEDTGVTTLVSDIDVIAIDGTNLGVGPHTLTGPGVLEMVATTVGNDLKFKCLIGVKQ